MRKVALVTGGTSGIGKAAAEALREKGCIVYTLSRRQENGENHFACDVSSEEAAREAVNALVKKEGRIDILVNCAGFGISGAAEETPLAKAKEQLNVNLFGTVNMVNAVLPFMRSQGGGRIVNTSSIAAIVPIPFQSWYSVSKAAINSYTMAIANEVKPFHITLCAVLPGDTKTGFTAARDKVADAGSVYADTVSRSVARMEKDEQNGVSAEKVGKLICKAALKKRVKPFYIPGFSYKLVNFIMRVLPSGAANRLIGMLYAG